MATLMKEKRREKKKSKPKHVSKADIDSHVSDFSAEGELSPLHALTLDINRSEESRTEVEQIIADSESNDVIQRVKSEEDVRRVGVEMDKIVHSDIITCTSNIESKKVALNIDEIATDSDKKISIEQLTSDKNIFSSHKNTPNHSKLWNDIEEEFIGLESKEHDMTPSAPILEQAPSVAQVPYTVIVHKNVEVTKAKVLCMPLEEAIRVYGGKEIAEVKAMSEREEAVVEGGVISGPEHPLVDLLSNFRLSLTAVERERVQLSCNIIEEEKTRSKLWNVQKRSMSVSEQCQCGANVELKALFDHAELLKEKLPAARMRLQSILRDVQESYCHYQHAALLAYCQIEDLISETVQGGKGEIREALSLILQALRLSDGAMEAYPLALQRWAAALAAALVDERDLAQLLFLLHHLFRQTRSVRWASRIVRMSVTDAYSAARAIAVMDLLLARPGLETAVECTEELEAWEEVDSRGGAGAVGEGRLREQDLCALLSALPLHALFARLTLFARADIGSGSPLEWGDASGGHGVVKCCCGVRAVLDVFARAAHAHGAYTRLHATLRQLASKLLHALAALHLHSRPLYMKDLEERIHVELEACFVAGFSLGGELERLPTSLLQDSTASDYCTSLIVALHDNKPRRIELLCIDAPVLSCDMRVRIVTQAAIDRPMDHDLARSVLEFLFQTGIKRRPTTFTCACDAAAREALPRVIAAHRYLHTTAFGVMADLCQVDAVEPVLVACLCPAEWRPGPAELRCVLDDWGQRCPYLLRQLLPQLNYTPHQGLSLETQLSLGSWLCWWQSQNRAGGASEHTWCWTVLCQLQVHRSLWHLPLDAAPPPAEEPQDMFSTAYSLQASAWSHCIPLACGPGAEALCRLAVSRPVEAVHCLDLLMRLMAQSPESISYTPKFTETLSILLNTGPSLVARALGRGGLSPADRLQRVVLSHLTQDNLPEPISCVLSGWLHALWKPSLPSSSRALLDAAARACRQWATLDAHVSAMLQEENSKEYISDAIRNASTAPLLCEAMLRGAHAQEVRTQTHARLLDALWRQRVAGQRIHVDNALKQINAFMIADDLVIHRTASALLVVPHHHPAHLTLWRLFFHIYLQRPPCSPQETTAPVGLLLFSGILKSRVLSQLKRRLQDTAAYHQKQAELLKMSSKTERPPDRPVRQEKSSPMVDTNIFPSLSIVDLTGGRCNDTSSDSDEEDGKIVASDATVEPEHDSRSQDTFNMICYHSAADKLMREYMRWLEEGERTRAAPHHADIARFIPEQALDTAWRLSIPQATSPESPLSPATPVQHIEFKNINTLQSHYERAVDLLVSVKDSSRRRPKRTSIKSLLRDVSGHDARSLLALVDKLLTDIQKLAQDWSSEVRYISKLDAQLWELVGALRVRRPLPPVCKNCTQCSKPVTVRIPEDEWCISTGAERGIQENRRSAHSALRRLARARPDVARTAATLHCIARRVRNLESAVRVVERAARYADAVEGCVLAKQALTALVTELAERWLCHNGAQCATLVRAWGAGEPSVQALCGALVSPRRLRPADWPAVYTAVLASTLPPHAAFSYLSKFQMSKWAETAEASQRREVVEALIAAAQRVTTLPASGDQHQVLLELLGVHACAVVTAQELCDHVIACARASASRRLPPAFCAAVARAVDVQSGLVPFDKLGHLQRQLGAVWWETRTSGTVTSSYAQYAEHVARMLQHLQRAFVAAAVAISYEPAAVAVYAWSAIRESWGPWVTPHASHPLLPSTGENEGYTDMLSMFVETINQVMAQCPGSEEALLRQVWEWAVQTYLTVNQVRSSQESRVQLSALLMELVRLPWRHQWFHLDSLKLALQAVSTGDKELNAWCGQTWRSLAASTWLRGATADTIAPALAALLALFTSPHAQHASQTLLEACNLPWTRLPIAALDEALERFYMDHYNVSLAYHDDPQFIVVLSASELRIAAGVVTALSTLSREKRARSVSQWVRAASNPALNAHVRAHSLAILGVIADLAPYLQRAGGEGELEELLSRAIIIMCMEAAASALPVWEEWVSRCTSQLRTACATAVASLTAFDYFAAMGETVTKAHLADKDSSGWVELRARWSACAWVDPAALAARGALHAAYVALLARPHAPDNLRNTFQALTSPHIRFENEAIIAVWICVVCRYGRAGASSQEEDVECRERARGALAHWGTEPRRTLLQVVALQPATPSPSARHRLLCNLAQCIIEPDETAARAYEASCISLLGPNAGDTATWGRTPHPKRLPRLAARLYPNSEVYFREELQLSPDAT